jgi:hypothetical protein
MSNRPASRIGQYFFTVDTSFSKGSGAGKVDEFDRERFFHSPATTLGGTFRTLRKKL